MARLSFDSGKLFDKTNTFRVQTVLFDLPPEEDDTFELDPSWSGSATFAWGADNIITANNAATALNSSIAPDIIASCTATSNSLTITLELVDENAIYGFIESSTISSGSTPVTYFVGNIKTANKDFTLFALHNGTSAQDFEVTYQGAFDGNDWWTLDSQGGAGPYALDAATNLRDSITEPWPKLRVLLAPTGVWSVASLDEVVTGWWGAKG